tara:strand:+ start:5208 stop:5663 length:456 start_codon:yes stop_codon:yes gene_type:complete
MVNAPYQQETFEAPPKLEKLSNCLQLVGISVHAPMGVLAERIMYGFRNLDMGVCKIVLRIKTADFTERVISCMKSNDCFRSESNNYKGYTTIHAVMAIQLYNDMQDLIRHARVSRQIAELQEKQKQLGDNIIVRELEVEFQHQMMDDDLPF